MSPTLLQRLRSLATDHEGSLALIGATLPIGCATSGSMEPPRPVDPPTPAMEPQDAGSDSLAEMFRDGSPEEVAAALEARVNASADASAADAATPRGASTSPPRPRPKPDPALPAPLYKGVSF